ncbi:hypothetical protein D3C71_1751330 [compost metagenome]
MLGFQRGRAGFELLLDVDKRLRNQDLALVFNAFVVLLVQVPLHCFIGVVAPAIELLGDPDGVMQHDSKATSTARAFL